MSVTTVADGSLTIRKALLTLFRLAVPTAASFCSTTLANTAAFAFVGSHTDEETQAAHALGFSIGNILVLMVGLGLINGMDTLCPLAIGIGHPEDTFVHLMQAFAIVIAAMVPLTPLIIFSKDLLILCKQDPTISSGASYYLQASFPGLFLICIYESIRRFLIYHQHILMQTIVSLFSIPIQIFFLWIFVGLLQMGTFGAGIARSLTWVVMSLTLLALTFIRREDFGWSKYISGRRGNDQQNRGSEQSERERNEDQREGQNTTSTTAEGHDPHLLDEICVVNPQAGGGESVATSGASEPEEGRDRGGTTGHDDTIQEGLPDATNVEIEVMSTPLRCCPKPSSIEIDHQPSHTQPSQSSPIHYQYDHWWKGIPKFLKIAIPSTFLCIFEWLSFEAQIFEAGYLGAVQLAALSAGQSFGTLIYFISLSVGITVNSQVGRYMGKLRPLDGRTVAKAGILGSFCISLPIACIVSLSRYHIAELFSSSPSIQEALRKNFLALSLGVVLADSLHVIIGGAIKALYLQWRAAIFDFIGLLIVMQAIGLALAKHTSLLGQGFVIGAAIGVYCVDVCYYIMLFCCINWSKRAKYLAGGQKRIITHSISSQR